jgi:hypothetical protein
LNEQTWEKSFDAEHYSVINPLRMHEKTKNGRVKNKMELIGKVWIFLTLDVAHWNDWCFFFDLANILNVWLMW